MDCDDIMWTYLAQESFQYQAFTVQRISYQFSLELYSVSKYIRDTTTKTI
jgi:hypothetical protein